MSDSETTLDEPQGNPGPPRLHEDAARFVRQRLLALEEGRDDDAKLLRDWLVDEFGCQVLDVDPASLPPGFRAHWRVPDRDLVSLLVNHGREPVWRIPTVPGAAPSVYETPLALIPPDPVTGVAFVGENAPAHLRPRLEGSGPLPAKVAKAIRPWGG